MADGYGFGAEGDWKTAILVRAAKVMGAGLPGGASLMEDYTYDLTPGRRADPRRAHAGGLPVADHEPADASRSTRWASAARRTRCAWSSTPTRASASSSSLADMRDRFRLTANVVDVVAPSAPLPHLPVARAVWEPRPDFRTSAEAWLTAGGAHHTVLTTAVGVEAFEDFAEIARTELLVIDESTTRRGFRDQVRWNQVYYRRRPGPVTTQNVIRTQSRSGGRLDAHVSANIHVCRIRCMTGLPSEQRCSADPVPGVRGVGPAGVGRSGCQSFSRRRIRWSARGSGTRAIVAGVAALALSVSRVRAAAATAATARAAPRSGGSDSGDAIVVGFSQVGSESGWRAANTKSIQDTLTAENGFDLKFSDAQQKQENQIQAIRSYIAQGVDYIAFSPVVESGWDAVLEEAKAANIPVDPHRPRGRHRGHVALQDVHRFGLRPGGRADRQVRLRAASAPSRSTSSSCRAPRARHRRTTASPASRTRSRTTRTSR